MAEREYTRDEKGRFAASNEASAKADAATDKAMKSHAPADHLDAARLHREAVPLAHAAQDPIKARDHQRWSDEHERLAVSKPSSKFSVDELPPPSKWEDANYRPLKVWAKKGG